MKVAASHTGKALIDYEKALDVTRVAATGPDCRRAALPGPGLRRGDNSIQVRHAREHNLKGIDVDIPREKFTVITGVSGSGKSTLAFDIIFAEGQRRYLESLNAYARQFVQPASKPDVDAIFGIPPTVAIEQRTSRGGSKSTVATQTEIHHFLRLLFVKLGTQYCPDCDVAHRAPERGSDRRAPDEGAARPQDCRARAPGHEPQGLLHRPREVGATARVCRTCASTAPTCRPRDGRGSTASASTRWSFRWREIDVTSRERKAAARSGRLRPRSRQGRAARARRRMGRARDPDLLREASVPLVRAQLSRSSTRASSRTTRSTAGAPRATARA